MPFHSQNPRAAAQDELEHSLLGLQIKGYPGAVEFASANLRNHAAFFAPPNGRIQAVILKITEAGHTPSVTHIAAELNEYPAFQESGGVEYLQNIAWRAPATTSPTDVHRRMAEMWKTWQHLSAPQPKAGDVELVTADSIAPKQIDWVWPGWLAAGKFHMIAGSPGTGKTTLSLTLAAVVTTGGQFPCGTTAQRGAALMWTGEDDLADSIVPRFLACGGSPSQLHLVKGIRAEDGSSYPFDPAADLDRLISAAKRIDNLRLLIIDPVVSAVAGDSHKNAETRRALQPLVDFAADAGVAALGITHYSKGTGGSDPAERVTGSLAFVAVPRLVMVTAKPKEIGSSRRLVRAKSNIGPDGGGFEYDLVQTAVDAAGLMAQAVQWGSALEGSAKALIAELEGPDDHTRLSALDAAKAWLTEILGTGTVRVPFLQDMARQAGHAWPTVERAKKSLGVLSVKQGSEGWDWRMPKVINPEEDAQSKS